VIDSGVDYRLEPASPPSIEVAGETRYGRSDAVPSRLAEPPRGLASVVLLASRDHRVNGRVLAALEETLPAGADVVVVADGLELGAPTSHEVVRTSAPLGRGAALNIGLRRASGAVVVALDTSIVPTGDVVTPLVDALRDPALAVVGPVGLVSSDLRRFEEVVSSAEAIDAAAIQGGLMAFRRADVAARGPLDEAFRASAYLDVWLSLLLRDGGEGRPPRRAVALPGLRFDRIELPESRPAASPERDRLAKRSFYRVLDRFRTRVDLAVPAPSVKSGADS
jgi:hypothetical protein